MYTFDEIINEVGDNDIIEIGEDEIIIKDEKGNVKRRFVRANTYGRGGSYIYEERDK